MEKPTEKRQREIESLVDIDNVNSLHNSIPSSNQPEILEADFKRRKIEEWKQRVAPSIPQSGPVLDIVAIKKQVEMRRKLALEALQRSGVISSSSGQNDGTGGHNNATSVVARLDIVKPVMDKNSLNFDRSLFVHGARIRRHRELRLAPQGKFILKATRARAESRLEDLKQQVAATFRRTGVGNALLSAGQAEQDLQTDCVQPPPDVEWWDVPILAAAGQISYELFFKSVGPEYDFNAKDTHAAEAGIAPITAFVLHPAPIKEPIVEPNSSMQSSSSFFRRNQHNNNHSQHNSGKGGIGREVMLTKKERQKLRRQRRLEEQRERQDKIRLGLLPPEQPKVRIANLMRVLRNESVQDPTKMENQARMQIEVRQQAHEKANKDRQLTDDQRREKIISKRFRDESRGLYSVLFKCRNLTHPLIRKKVDLNAEQLGLTGLGVIFQNYHVVLVEGGARALRQFKTLMLRRIRWSQKREISTREKTLESVENLVNQTSEKSEDFTVIENGLETEMNNCDEDVIMDELEEEDDNDDNGKYLGSDEKLGVNTVSGCGGCSKVWEGEIEIRAFKSFRFRSCLIERQVIDLFKSGNVEHYWTHAKSWVSATF